MERVFKFYGNYGDLPETFASRQVMRTTQDRINNDTHIIERAKSTNQLLFSKISEITSDPENTEFVGIMVIDLLNKIPRYSYIKNVEYNGSAYDVEIDLVSLTFTFHEI